MNDKPKRHTEYTMFKLMVRYENCLWPCMTLIPCSFHDRENRGEREGLSHNDMWLRGNAGQFLHLAVLSRYTAVYVLV